MRHLPAISIHGYVDGRVGVENFWGQSIGIDETNIFQVQFFSTMKVVGATGLGGLWALEWAWHPAETNLRCAGISGICMSNPSIVALIVSEISG